LSKVLIIEDEVAIADLEKDYLELSGFGVEIENDGNQGLERALSEEFDMFILDLMLPGVDGFEICKRIRENKNTPILMVSAKKDDIDKIRGLGLGADDYITKPFGTNELRARVNAHLRRDVREKKNSFSISGVIFRLNAKEAEINSKKVPLTKSEYEICEYLARHHGQTFTREQIYEAVFGFDGESDSSVISTHVKNIRGKLAEFHLSTIETIWGVGYKWV